LIFILRHIKVIFFITLIFIIISGFSYTYFFEEKSYEQTEFFLNTVINIKAYGEHAKEAVNDSFARIKEIESEMNVHDPESMISVINSTAYENPVEINSDLKYVIGKGLFYSEITEGYFDISIKPIADLWQIGTENARVPEQNEIIKALNYVGYRNINLKEDTIFFDISGTQIDLGGIAKGYAADEIYKIMETYEINRAYGNLGGNVIVYGEKKINFLQKLLNKEKTDSQWKIGIQNPSDVRGSYVAVLSVKNTSIVTSGAYERYFETNGNIYHHILNPFTGYPSESDLLSTTVICKSSIDADALSTSLFILGYEKGKNLIDSLPDVEAIFIKTNNEVVLTEGIKNSVQVTDSTYFISP
jgi:thiamine biosynthesis lipoprotein